MLAYHRDALLGHHPCYADSVSSPIEVDIPSTSGLGSPPACFSGDLAEIMNVSMVSSVHYDSHHIFPRLAKRYFATFQRLWKKIGASLTLVQSLRLSRRESRSLRGNHCWFSQPCHLKIRYDI